MSPVGFSVARYATWAKAVGLKGPCIGNEITPDLVFCRSQWGASVCFSCGSGTVAYARWHWSEPSSVFCVLVSLFGRRCVAAPARERGYSTTESNTLIKERAGVVVRGRRLQGLVHIPRRGRWRSISCSLR